MGRALSEMILLLGRRTTTVRMRPKPKLIATQWDEKLQSFTIRQTHQRAASSPESFVGKFTCSRSSQSLASAHLCLFFGGCFAADVSELRQPPNYHRPKKNLNRSNSASSSRLNARSRGGPPETKPKSDLSSPLSTARFAQPTMRSRQSIGKA